VNDPERKAQEGLDSLGMIGLVIYAARMHKKLS
jgi:hypothetical protein